MNRLALPLALVFVALTLSPAAAEGWLWPFSSKKEPARTIPRATAPPQFNKPKATPSTWDTMTSGPKKVLGWMNPFSSKSTAGKTTSNSAAAPKNNFISSSNKPLDDKPKSVPEFLSLPRPGEK